LRGIGWQNSGFNPIRSTKLKIQAGLPIYVCATACILAIRIPPTPVFGTSFLRFMTQRSKSWHEDTGRQLKAERQLIA
ncbi:MAG: hypothetical protein ACREXY_20655, partial [Gammaproteobacteria bacterium]